MSETYKDGETLNGTQEGPLIHGSDGGASGTVTVLPVTSSGVASVPSTSILDTGNSTVAQLGAAAAFTGVGVDLLGYSAVAITLHSSHDSAASGMSFEFSQDDTNWDDVYTFTLDFSESPTRRFQFPICARYFRVVYTNGGTLTTGLRIQTLLHRSNILTSIHKVESTVVGDRSVELVKAVITGETTAGGGAFVNVKVNPSGTLEVNATIDDELPAGTNNIGDVDIASALPAGTNNIGDVDVLTMPDISHGKTILTVTGDDNTVDSHLLIAAPGAGSIYVCAYYIAAVGATLQTAAFQDGEDGTDMWTVVTQAPADVTAGANLAVSAPAYIFKLTATTALYLDLLAAVKTYWSVSYWVE